MHRCPFHTHVCWTSGQDGPESQVVHQTFKIRYILRSAEKIETFNCEHVNSQNNKASDSAHKSFYTKQLKYSTAGTGRKTQLLGWRQEEKFIITDWPWHKHRAGCGAGLLIITWWFDPWRLHSHARVSLGKILIPKFLQMLCQQCAISLCNPPKNVCLWIQINVVMHLENFNPLRASIFKKCILTDYFFTLLIAHMALWTSHMF